MSDDTDERKVLRGEIDVILAALSINDLRRVHRSLELFKYHATLPAKAGDEPTTRSTQRAASHPKRTKNA